MTAVTLALISTFTLAASTARSSSPVQKDWHSAYRYWHGVGQRQRARADDLQARLTVRVLEVRRMRDRLGEVRRLRYMLSKHAVPDAVTAIRLVFGPYGEQAVRVSSCETGGTFDVNAQNGQYLGLFQMGSYARGRYGHSYTALGQAQAAYRYFVDSGRDWSPWECQP